MKQQVSVHIFFRRPVHGSYYSIERLFTAIAAALPRETFKVKAYTCPFFSRGLVPRLASVIWAYFHRGQVNHVTGDIHYIALGLPGRRTILTVHDLGLMTRLSGWRRHIYRKIWIAWPTSRCRFVTVISDAVEKELRASLNECLESELVTIPNCVTVPVQDPSSVRGLAESPKVLLVGTMENKNLSRILQALRGVPCRIVIVGELSDDQRAAIAANQLDVENRIGLDDDGMLRAYDESDVIVFASTYEGFGLPILEAQARGRPVITSARSPMQEVAGTGACLVDPEDVGEIARAIRKVLSDKAYRDQLTSAGFANVRRYSASEVALRYSDLYEQVAKEQA